MKIRRACISVILLFFCQSLQAQTSSVREEYLKILPFRSTLEDVNKSYGHGKVRAERPGVFLSKEYLTADGAQVRMQFFPDCRQEKKSGKQNSWVVRSVFFNFNEAQKLAPKDIYLQKLDFTRYLYGDVFGQIIYKNAEDSILFTYVCNQGSVSSLSVGPTVEDREEYSCYEPKVESGLDPAQFTEIEQDSDLGTFCCNLKTKSGLQ